MKRIFILMVAMVCSAAAAAQCPLCTPDFQCISVDGYPTICPLVAPNATVGEYYEHVLTFYIPTEVEDPGSGVLATLLEVKVTNVAGMPYGLEFTINDADSTYHPVDGENHGCATVCGVPVLPGIYTINITVNILATAFGFEVTQVQSFPYTLVVDPGEGGTNSFSFDNPAACGNLTTTFEATIVAPSPSVTTYDWDFGNGSTGTDAIETITYDEVGEYEVVLETTVANYGLAEVTVSNLSTAGNGDVDDFFSPPADPYFMITDGSNNTVYTSASVSNTTSTSWALANFLLSNPPYSIQFFDDDDVSADDNLGTTDVLINAGANYFDIGNGTVGTYTISLIPATVIYDTATVVVFGLPDATFVVGGSNLYYDNPELTGFVWHINDIPTSNFSSSIDLEAGGEYYCVVTNAYGCTATSQTYLHCPDIEVQFDAPSSEVYVDDIYATYQWYFNGAEMPGATDYYVYADQDGNYSVQITTSYGCNTLSNVYTLVSVTEQSSKLSELWPVPASDLLYISCATWTGATPVEVYDMRGQLVLSATLRLPVDAVDIKSLASGCYIVQMNNEYLRLIKQ
ncbi:MAG: PKD domain-containing protein [Flavobacteriales bacterium]